MFSFKVIYAYDMLHIKTQTFSTVMTQMASRTMFFFTVNPPLSSPSQISPLPLITPPPPFLGEES